MILASASPSLRSLLDRYGSGPLPLSRGSLSRVDISSLGDLTPGTLFPTARNPEAALSGLLLRLGHWDKCHELAQDLSSADGSFWHAIAHRLEPDDFNAGYWYRRVGTHPVYALLHSRAAAILRATPVAGWNLSHRWDPELLVRWSSEARSIAGQHPQDARVAVAAALGQAEWELLFSWCAFSPA
jgi:hypothetical protein